jgi:hypothetical protein
MHWRTFERLVREEEWANYRSIVAAVAQIRGLAGRFGGGWG